MRINKFFESGENIWSVLLWMWVVLCFFNKSRKVHGCNGKCSNETSDNATKIVICSEIETTPVGEKGSEIKIGSENETGSDIETDSEIQTDSKSEPDKESYSENDSNDDVFNYLSS